MILFTDTLATPFGPFSVALNAEGAVVATAFGPVEALRARLSARSDVRLEPRALRTAAVRAQVDAYVDGERATFDLPLAPAGTAFQQLVWAGLKAIPAGCTESYAALARRVGSSPRAVGGANASNPICLIVPCHRVIGQDGSLTGFAFGTALKARLLAHERRYFAAEASPAVA